MELCTRSKPTWPWGPCHVAAVTEISMLGWASPSLYPSWGLIKPQQTINQIEMLNLTRNSMGGPKAGNPGGALRHREQRAGSKLPRDGSGGAGTHSRLEAFGSNWILKRKKPRFNLLLFCSLWGFWEISSGTQIPQRKSKMWRVLMVRALPNSFIYNVHLLMIF